MIGDRGWTVDVCMSVEVMEGCKLNRCTRCLQANTLFAIRMIRGHYQKPSACTPNPYLIDTATTYALHLDEVLSIVLTATSVAPRTVDRRQQATHSKQQLFGELELESDLELELELGQKGQLVCNLLTMAEDLALERWMICLIS